MPRIEYRDAGGNEFAGVPAYHDQFCKRRKCSNEKIRLGKRVASFPARFQHEAPTQERILGNGEYPAGKQWTQRAIEPMHQVGSASWVGHLLYAEAHLGEGHITGVQHIARLGRHERPDFLGGSRSS